MHYLTLGRWENADFAVFGNLFDCHGSLVTGHDVVPVVSNAGKRRFCTAGFASGGGGRFGRGPAALGILADPFRGKYGFLYILDCGMSDETAQICRRFAREYGNIEIGSLAQLEQRLTGGGDLQP